MSPNHSPINEALVHTATSFGLHPPTYSEDDAPTLWATWERLVLDVIMAASHQDNIVPLVEKANQFSGHDIMQAEKP